MEDRDRILANLAKNIAAPPLRGPKSRKKAHFKDFLYFSPEDSSATRASEPSNVVDLEEKRREYLKRHMQKFGSPTVRKK